MPPAAGVLVEFRDNVSDALLWEAVMNSVPQKDDVVGWSLTGGVPVMYEVQRVRFVFRQPTSQPGGQGGPSTPSSTVCQHTPTVYVTAQ